VLKRSLRLRPGRTWGVHNVSPRPPSRLRRGHPAWSDQLAADSCTLQ